MATPPFDPTRALGSVWCVTVTGLPVPDALFRVGVEDVAELPDGRKLASRRLADATAAQERTVLVLARRVEPNRSLLLETESALGWLGADPEVLADLAAPGTGTACSITKDPNRTWVLFAQDGHVTAGLDAVTGLVHGDPGSGLSVALSASGLTVPGGAPEEWTSAQRAAHALWTATDVRLLPGTWDGPWTGGLSTGVT